VDIFKINNSFGQQNHLSPVVGLIRFQADPFLFHVTKRLSVLLPMWTLFLSLIAFLTREVRLPAVRDRWNARENRGFELSGKFLSSAFRDFLHAVGNSEIAQMNLLRGAFAASSEPALRLRHRLIGSRGPLSE
jgi:hypothetical protein